jgi:hypothetical protein
MDDFVRQADGSEVSVFYLTVDTVPIAFPKGFSEAMIRETGLQYAGDGHTVALRSYANSAVAETL